MVKFPLATPSYCEVILQTPLMEVAPTLTAFNSQLVAAETKDRLLNIKKPVVIKIANKTNNESLPDFIFCKIITII
jgi:hypothetical protein